MKVMWTSCASSGSFARCVEGPLRRVSGPPGRFVGGLGIATASVCVGVAGACLVQFGLELLDACPRVLGLGSGPDKGLLVVVEFALSGGDRVLGLRDRGGEVGCVLLARRAVVLLRGPASSSAPDGGSAARRRRRPPRR